MASHHMTEETANGASDVSFEAVRRRTIRHQFDAYETSAREEFQERRLLRDSLNIGAAILTNKLAYTALSFVFARYFGDSTSVMLIAALVHFIMAVVNIILEVVVEGNALQVKPGTTESYILFDVWSLIWGTNQMMINWSLRDTIICGIGALNGFRDSGAMNPTEELAVACGLGLFVVAMQICCEHMQAKDNEYQRLHGSAAGHSKLREAVLGIPSHFALALGWAWNNVLEFALAHAEKQLALGVFLGFFLRVFYCMIVTYIISYMIARLTDEVHPGKIEHAFVAVISKTAGFVYAWSIQGAVMKFYYDVMWQCSGSSCSYQSKFTYAILISIVGSSLNMLIKHLLAMERETGQTMRKCSIKAIRGPHVEWEMTTIKKTGLRKAQWESMATSMSLIIGWSWAAFFVSLVKPVEHASVEAFGVPGDMQGTVSCFILCVIYWALVVPLYHQARSNLRLVQMEQMEAFVRMLDQAREHDKVKGQTEALLPELLSRVEKLVAKTPLPILAPELVESVEKTLLPEFRKDV
eukprot:TRINITY_DN4431_c0_g1_i1.p1 TRINITY_DN4431_c0_g1~~TRINITY_DN4431_c0_g1_i1.p1  ORF type:complete len:525 (+),score=141.94 TRINITY_DN4431_c0_g1_i1:75-1649(+)